MRNNVSITGNKFTMTTEVYYNETFAKYGQNETESTQGV